VKGGGSVANERSQRPANENVVFSIIQASTCSECGDELAKGSLLRKIDDKALCLSCADLDHLVMLSPGNAALTRRSTKYSRLHAVVVRWSRARHRYERQGVLVEEAALRRAEEECLGDAEMRAVRRDRDALRRARLDAVFVDRFAAAILERYPGCPPDTARIVAEHACEKHSGRVGRSAGAKEFARQAIELAVVAHVRHRHSNYDELLSEGMDRSEARREIRAPVDEVLARWELKPGAD